MKTSLVLQKNTNKIITHYLNNIYSKILYEDNHVIIVNKDSKIPVQGDKTQDITLIDIFKLYIQKKYNKPGNVFLGLPHRIDRPSSGIIVLCKTSKSLSRITSLFREKKIYKTYHVYVHKQIRNYPKKLIHFLKKNKQMNKSFVKNKQTPGYLKAELSYKLIESNQNNYIYEVKLITGRHHQIRAQLSHIGSPKKGDLKYGAKKPNIDRSICLHAHRIEFIHPIQNKNIIITSPRPNKEFWKI